MNDDYPRSPVLDRRQPDVVDAIGRGFFATFPVFLICMAFTFLESPFGFLVLEVLYPIPMMIGALDGWVRDPLSLVSPLSVSLAALQFPLLSGLKAWINPSPQWRKRFIAIHILLVLLATYVTYQASFIY